MNSECDKNALNSMDRKLWGCDGDFACNQACYDAARRQMDALCSASDESVERWLLGGKL